MYPPYLLIRFWLKVDKHGPILIARLGRCWEWGFATDEQGYGRFSLFPYGDRSERVHRIAWELAYGPVPNGLCVLHKCDNRVCVRPSHLFVGTHYDNARDRESKDRGAKGTRQPAAKLSDVLVADILHKWQGGEHTQNQLSKIYNVSPTLISFVVNQKRWT